MTLKDAVAQTRISYRNLAQVVHLSPAAMSRLLNDGEYPSRRNAGEIVTAFQALFAEHGLNPDNIDFPGHKGRAFTSQEQDDLMKLDSAILSHFRFSKDPFVNDVDSDKDVFQHKSYKKLERTIREAIDECGMIALAGSVGSGKTTLMDGIEADYAGREDVVICKPYVKNKERLTDNHLTRALLYSLNGENSRIPANAEDQGRLLSRTLIALQHGDAGGRRAILYIDDAHHCTASVLRTLKAFYEEKVGRRRLLAIILVGTEELARKLSTSPEVGNRARLLEVPKVGVREYLDFKLQRVNSSLEKVFEPAALDAFLGAHRRSGSAAVGYPLPINNTLTRVLTRMFEAIDVQPGQRIPAEIVAKVFDLPRRAA